MITNAVHSQGSLVRVNSLCGLVNYQAGQHCYGSPPYAPFTGSRQGGVSHDCARLSEPRSFDDGQDRGSIPAHTFPRSVTARSRGSHESAMRCVTCRGDGCGHRGVVPVPRVHWPGAEQGFHGGKATCCSGHVICQTTERSLQVRRAAHGMSGYTCGMLRPAAPTSHMTV